MKNKYWSLIVSFALALGLSTACQKLDDEPAAPSPTGKPYSSLPQAPFYLLFASVSPSDKRGKCDVRFHWESSEAPAGWRIEEPLGGFQSITHFSTHDSSKREAVVAMQQDYQEVRKFELRTLDERNHADKRAEIEVRISAVK